MQFLNPGLFGLLLPLVALPLFIHLFNRKVPQRHWFPTVQFLKKTVAERSKLARWRHLIMTALRTLIVLLLALAFLKPVSNRFGADPQAEQTKRHVLILLDRSLSMEHSGGLVNARKRALTEVEKILNTLRDQDSANIILVGKQPRKAFYDFTQNHGELARYVTELGPSYEEADFAKANLMAAKMLLDVEGPSELYSVSDFQRESWSNASFNGFPQSTRFFFVNAAGKGMRDNTAITQAQLNKGRVTSGELVTLDLRLGNFRPSPWQANVQVLLSGGLLAEKTLELENYTMQNVQVSFRAPEAGRHVLEIETEEDALPGDNRVFLVFEVKSKEEVLVISDDLEEGGSDLFIRTALNPYEEAEGAVVTTSLGSTDLNPVNLSTTSKGVVTSVGLWNEEQAQQITRFISNGGGLIYFLDGDFDVRNLELMEAATGESFLPLQLMGKQSPENLAGGTQQLAKGKFESPFLKLFRDRNRESLGQLRFYSYYRCSASTLGEVVLWYADGTPAMGLSTWGLGTIVLCNFSPAELSSNLARQRIFPAWLHEMRTQLTADEIGEQSYEVGTTIQDEIWASEIAGSQLTGPDESPVETEENKLGDIYLMSFQADQPGLYSLRKNGERLQAYAANVPGTESDLRSMDLDMLPQRTGQEASQEGHFVEGSDDYKAINEGQRVFHYFLLIVLALMLLEMLLGKALSFSPKTASS